MPKKKPTRKTRKKPARTKKPTRSKKRARRKPATRKSRAGGVAVVEVLEITTVSGDVSEAEESEVPTEEAPDNDFPPEYGGEK
jgi:hypothetical protein